MSKGRRYERERKLNIKKVIAVILAILVVIMFVLAIKKLLTPNEEKGIKTNVTSYYPLYTNEKWGVINNEGQIVIAPTYDEIITIPNSKTDIFICVYDVDYKENTYKTIVIDSKNKEKFTEYDKVEAIENIDENNILWFEEGVLKVQNYGKYGLIDTNGNMILEAEYDQINALQGTKNSLIITKDGKQGLVDNKGNIIIEPEYKEIKSINNDYTSGYIVVNNDNKYGVIDFTKKEILEPKYEEIKQISGSNIYIVKEAGKIKAINKDAKTLVEEKFDDIKSINEENIVFKKGSKYGVINTSSEIKIDAQYDNLDYAFGNNYIAKKDGKYGIVNTDGETKLPFEYTQISYRKEADFIEVQKQGSTQTQIISNQFEEKLQGTISDLNSEKGYFRIRQQEQYNYYNFKFEQKTLQELEQNRTLYLSKKDGKYGYTDKSGNIVVDYIYEDATEQNNYGFVSVKKDGKWGSLDKDGNVIQPPKYELQNNILIDFIGKYHVSEDLNAYYYTDN